MLSINWPVILGCGLIPMVVGFLYYNPKTLEPAWMKSTGLTREDVDGGNMLMIMGISFLLSCVISMMMVIWTTHQFSMQGLFAMDPDFAAGKGPMYDTFQDLMSKYGDRHRTFGHGAAHGAFAGLGIAFPIIAIKSLFERKSWTHIFISAGYWLITLVLICGVACAYAVK